MERTREQKLDFLLLEKQAKRQRFPTALELTIPMYGPWKVP